MSERAIVGISPCPNDTFAFAGLLEGEVVCAGAELEFQLRDVQELNQRLARGEFDAAKASFHAALWLSETTAVLSADYGRIVFVELQRAHLVVVLDPGTPIDPVLLSIRSAAAEIERRGRIAV